MIRCQEQLNVGAYLLELLEPDERHDMGRHLAACSACRAELEDLSGLPAHLAAADVTDLLEHPVVRPSDLALRRLQDAAVRAQSRRRRWRGAGAAAAVVLALVLVGVAVAGRGVDQRQVLTAAAGAVHGRAELTPAAGGTRVVLTLDGVAPGERCRLVAVGRRGSTETASTWTATYDGQASITAAVHSRSRDIDRLVIQTLDGRTLLTLHPAT